MGYVVHRFPLYKRFFNTVFHCHSKGRETIFSYNTLITLECSFKFLFRAHAGFIIAQLKTLSIRQGSQGKQQYTNKRRIMSSLGTVMYFLIKSCFSQKLFFDREFRKAFSAFIPPVNCGKLHHSTPLPSPPLSPNCKMM